MKIRLTVLSLLLVASLMSLTAACNHAKADPLANDAAKMGDSNNSAAPFAGSSAQPTNGAAAQPASAAPKPEAARPLTLAAGTPVAVRMQTSVSSAQSRSGDRFEAVLAEPLKSNGVTVAPAGTLVTGQVTNAESSGRLEHPGQISITLVSLNLKGHNLPIQTSQISAKAGSHKKRNAEWIGGGAATGAVLGGIFGGGKGALIGAGAGAGAGTATAAATGKKDVTIASEQKLVFKLAQPVTVNQ